MAGTMQAWDPGQYLKFEDERTRPSRDLLARIPNRAPRTVMDIGCGPGNSTELLVERFPEAEVEGSDNSEAMLAKARQRLPGVAFSLVDATAWAPERRYDVVFANAVLQWLPDHRNLLPRLAATLAPGGTLAVQMPDNVDEPSHVAMREVAAAGPWAETLAGAAGAKTAIARFDDYHDWLTATGCRVEVWKTTYVHPLAGPEAIVDWFLSTGLKPFVDPLDAAERADYLERYRARVAEAHPRRADGSVLLPFPRLFIVATRPA